MRPYKVPPRPNNLGYSAASSPLRQVDEVDRGIDRSDQDLDHVVPKGEGVAPAPRLPHIAHLPAVVLREVNTLDALVHTRVIPAAKPVSQREITVCSYRGCTGWGTVGDGQAMGWIQQVGYYKIGCISIRAQKNAASSEREIPRAPDHHVSSGLSPHAPCTFPASLELAVHAIDVLLVRAQADGDEGARDVRSGAQPLDQSVHILVPALVGRVPVGEDVDDQRLGQLISTHAVLHTKGVGGRLIRTQA